MALERIFLENSKTLEFGGLMLLLTPSKKKGQKIRLVNLISKKKRSSTTQRKLISKKAKTLKKVPIA